MRIALCLSGSPRFIKECYQFTHDNIMSAGQCDVFIHAWNHLTPPLMQEVLDYFKPVSHQFDDQLPLFGTGATGNARSMWASHKFSNELKRAHENNNNFKYDAVVRHRFDNLMLSRFTFTNLEENTIYLKAYNNWNSYDDRFAYGTSTSMDLFAGIADYATEDKTSKFCAEDLLPFYFKECGLRLFSEPYDAFIVRPPGYPHYAHPQAEWLLGQVRKNLGI